MAKNSKEIGDQTEIAVIYEMIKRGHRVSIPFGDNDKYDILVDSGDKIFRVQCKTAWRIDSDTIGFNTHSQTTRDGRYYQAGYAGEIDAFVVRFPEEVEFYWIPIDDAADHRMQLRFDSQIDHPAINWAEEYNLDQLIPF